MSTSELLQFDYLNWQGKRSTRTVKPETIWFGETEYHPEPQWFLNAFDIDKEEFRDFAINDIIGKKRIQSKAG